MVLQNKSCKLEKHRAIIKGITNQERLILIDNVIADSDGQILDCCVLICTGNERNSLCEGVPELLKTTF